MRKWKKSVTIPYFYEEHIGNEKRNIKRQLLQEIAEEMEENKKYTIEIKTVIKDECCVGGYEITADIEIAEITQIEVEFIPQRETLQPAPKTRKSILQKIKEHFKGGSRYKRVWGKGE